MYSYPRGEHYFGAIQKNAENVKKWDRIGLRSYNYVDTPNTNALITW